MSLVWKCASENHNTKPIFLQLCSYITVEVVYMYKLTCDVESTGFILQVKHEDDHVSYLQAVKRFVVL